MHNKPVTNATIKAIIVGITGVSNTASPLVIPRISNSIDPSIIGMLIKNEKRVTRSRLAPHISPAQIVVPEREIPGRIASA